MSRPSRWLIACVVLTYLSACDPFAARAADVDDPQTFGEGDLSFDYPGNWKISTERETVESFSMVSHTLEPRWGNSLVVVQVFRPGLEIEFEKLLADFWQGMSDSLAGSLIEKRPVDGKDSVEIHHDLLSESREGRRIRFAVEVLGESTVSTVDIYLASLDDRTIVVYAQAPDDELSQARPGFEQIMGTMKISR